MSEPRRLKPNPGSCYTFSSHRLLNRVDRKKAIIIGAGPAGLTAAYELLTRTGIKPIVLEKSDCMGGISRTVNYKGNRIDIGGHRFFSKSDRVMEWWLRMLPLQASEDGPGGHRVPPHGAGRSRLPRPVPTRPRRTV